MSPFVRRGDIMKLRLITELKIHDTRHVFNNTDKIYTYDETTKSYNFAG